MRNYDDKNAFQYDSIRHGHLFNRRFSVVKKFLNDILPSNINLIAEIGCGSGRLSYSIAKEFSNSRVMAVELNDSFIKYAKENFQRDNLHYMTLDITKSALPEKSDVIITVDAIHHLVDLDRGIENIKKSLKNGGFWIAIEPNIKNFYMFILHSFEHNEKYFYQFGFEKRIKGKFEILEKRYAFLIPHFIKTPPTFLKKIEKKMESIPFLGGSVTYLLEKK